MDVSRLCSVTVKSACIKKVSLSSITGTVTVAVTSRAPTRLTISEVKLDLLSTEGTTERAIIHGWAENISLNAFTTTEVPVPITVTSIETIHFLTGALTRDMNARVRGTAKIDAYISEITIPFDNVVTLPSILTR